MNYAVVEGMVQVPLKDFKRMERSLGALEEKADVKALDDALKNDDELIPGDVAKALVLEGSPVRTYRKYRGLTQEALGKMVGVTKTTISEVENGRKEGSLKLFKRLSEALGVDIDDLI